MSSQFLLKDFSSQCRFCLVVKRWSFALIPLRNSYWLSTVCQPWDSYQGQFCASSKGHFAMLRDIFVLFCFHIFRLNSSQPRWLEVKNIVGCFPSLPLRKNYREIVAWYWYWEWYQVWNVDNAEINTLCLSTVLGFGYNNEQNHT